MKTEPWPSRERSAIGACISCASRLTIARPRPSPFLRSPSAARRRAGHLVELLEDAHPLLFADARAGVPDLQADALAHAAGR